MSHLNTLIENKLNEQMIGMTLSIIDKISKTYKISKLKLIEYWNQANESFFISEHVKTKMIKEDKKPKKRIELVIEDIPESNFELEVVTK